MDYKQKYEQALEYMRTVYPTLNGAAKEDVEHYFPELKESEDEKIRKMLVEQMERWHKCAIENNVVQDIKDSADAIAWLEKQGGKIDIVNKGYWRGYREGKQEIIDKYSELEKQGKKSNIPQDTEDDLRRQSTIQVLEYARSLDAYNQYGKASINKNIAWLEKQDPKKHEEELEKAYKTADEVQYRKGFEDGVASVKPVEWSEDGEMMINTIIYDLERHGGKEDSNYSAEINWLKSLKERYIWKPNEEQLSVLNEVINYAASDPSMHWNDYLYNILKQLKHQLLKLKGE